MRALPAILLVLLLMPALPAWAQTPADDGDTQHLSAEEFLDLDNPKPKAGAEKPAPVDGAEAAAPAGTTAATGDAPAAPSPFDEEDEHKRQMEDRSIVKLRTIDKLSARTHTFDIPVGKTVKFGKSLFIKARACRTASPLDEPENAAFLQIWERLPAEEPGGDETSRWIFSGWMFSSSPSLSAMEHPIYDVWVIDCKNDATVAESETYSAEKTPAATVDAAAAADAAKDGKDVKDVKAAEGAKPVAASAPGTGSKPPATPEQMAPVEPVAGGSAAVPALQELPGSFEDGDDDQ